MSETNELRIGVYTCYCGGNISDVVRCEEVAEALRDLPDVVVSRTDMSMCSDAGQAMVEEDIRERGVNRVVIGACSPSLHEQTFRQTVARAGLNPYLYHHVGLREQVSWVHANDPDKATQKAIALMSAGIAKARHLKPLHPILLEAKQHALVIGGGVAGLQSALSIARLGIRVTLVEKTPFLGGRTAQLETVFPTEEDARTLVHQLIKDVVAHPSIEVYTRAEVTAVRGYVGDMEITISQQPRGVGSTGEDMEEAIAACPVEVPDEFNYGLTSRKALYRAYPGCYPSTPAIDWEHCTRCGKCAEAAPEVIDLAEEATTFDVNVGSVVVATGFKPYTPREGELGYGEHPAVITLPQLIRLLALNGDESELEWQGSPVRSIALIHCVGSRQIPGIHEPGPDGEVNDYCSRVCCTASLHTALTLRERFPDVNVFELYQDIRTYGRGHEDYYRKAAQEGVVFLGYRGETPPEVRLASEGSTHPLVVRVQDFLTNDIELDVPVDLVVLAVGVVPSETDDLVKLLKINQGTDRFLLEVHPKLQPVETPVPGVVLAGSAQGPMNIQESSAAALAAASKVGGLLGRGEVELEPFVARVDPELCDGCGECLKVCSYEDALYLTTAEAGEDASPKAVVTPANCGGCGACVAVCPQRALELQGWTLEQYEAMVEAIAKAEELFEKEVSA